MARPKTNPEKHRKNVAITLDPVLLLDARTLAAAGGKSLSQIIEDLLYGWIFMKKASDVMQAGTPPMVITEAMLKTRPETILASQLDSSAEASGNPDTRQEDPFVTEARKAAENTLSRDEARRAVDGGKLILAVKGSPPVMRQPKASKILK